MPSCFAPARHALLLCALSGTGLLFAAPARAADDAACGTGSAPTSTFVEQLGSLVHFLHPDPGGPPDLGPGDVLAPRPDDALPLPGDLGGDVISRVEVAESVSAYEVDLGEGQGEIATGPYAGANVEFKGRLDPSTGTVDVEITFAAESGVGNTVEARSERGGVELSELAGIRTRSTWHLHVSEADFQAMLDGTFQIPDPLDPATLPVGSSVLVASEAFHTDEVKANLRSRFFFSEFLEERYGLGIAVERLDENTVRVAVGPFHELEQRLRLGLGLGGVKLLVGANENLAFSRTENFDLDLTTPEGQEVYEALMLQGVMPEPEGDGVDRYEQVDTIHYDHAVVAGVSYGDAFAGFALNHTDSTVYNVTREDGIVEQTWVANNHNGLGAGARLDLLPDGSADLLFMEFEAPEAYDAITLLQVAGLPFDEADALEGPVRVRFTEDSYRQLREDTLDLMDQMLRDRGYEGDTDSLSHEERMALYDRYFSPIGAVVPMGLAIARSPDPADFIAATGGFTPGGFFEGLAALHAHGRILDTEVPLEGAITVYQPGATGD